MRFAQDLHEPLVECRFGSDPKAANSFVFWRRKRDSNPRTSHPVNGFQDRRLQPLGHSSIFKVANSWWIPQSEPDLRRIGLAKIDQGHCGSNFSISSATCFACKLAPSLLK